MWDCLTDGRRFCVISCYDFNYPPLLSYFEYPAKHLPLCCDTDIQLSGYWKYILKYQDSNHSSSFCDHYQLSKLFYVYLKLKILNEVQWISMFGNQGFQNFLAGLVGSCWFQHRCVSWCFTVFFLFYLLFCVSVFSYVLLVLLTFKMFLVVFWGLFFFSCMCMHSWKNKKMGEKKAPRNIKL